MATHLLLSVHVCRDTVFKWKMSQQSTGNIAFYFLCTNLEHVTRWKCLSGVCPIDFMCVPVIFFPVLKRRMSWWIINESHFHWLHTRTLNSVTGVGHIKKIKCCCNPRVPNLFMLTRIFRDFAHVIWECMWPVAPILTFVAGSHVQNHKIFSWAQTGLACGKCSNTLVFVRIIFLFYRVFVHLGQLDCNISGHNEKHL